MKLQKPRAVILFLIGCLMIFMFQNATVSSSQFQPVEISGDVSSLGPALNIEFRGNESNIKAYYNPADPYIAALPYGYFKNHYPNFNSVRLGNTFFGYDCITATPSADQVSVATKDANGNVVYNFEQLKSYYREMLRSGEYPLVTLTGFPKVLYRPNTDIYTRDTYGCTTVPPIDFIAGAPADRMPEFANLLRAYFGALKSDPVIAPTLSQWNFATWAEPWSKNLTGHLILDQATLDRFSVYSGVSQSDPNFTKLVKSETIATLLATTIGVAREFNLPIHFGNFAGDPQELQAVMTRIRQFTGGPEIANYAKAISFSRYAMVSDRPGRVGYLIQNMRRFNTDVSQKEAYLNEFGLLGFDANQDVWEAEPSLWNGVYTARALENVFNMYDPNQRSITKVNFWHDNLMFLPRAIERARRFDDYLKKPSYHAMNFFSRLIGLRRLNLSSSEPAKIGVAGGRAENSYLTRLVVFNESIFADTFLDEATRASKSRTAHIVLKGYPSLRDFSVTVHKVDHEFGNPVKDVIGGDFDYRLSPDLFFNTTKREFESQGSILTRINDPVFFKNARKTDDPVVRSILTQSSADGTIELNVALGPNELALVEIQKVSPSSQICSENSSMAINFTNSLIANDFAPLIAKAVSLDDGFYFQNPSLQSEKSHGLRLFADSQLTYPCSFLQPESGSTSLRFKISASEVASQSEQILLSSHSGDARHGVQLRLSNGSLVASMMINGLNYSGSYTLLPGDFDKWNIVKVAWSNSILQLGLNGTRKATVTLTGTSSLSTWNFKLDLGQANRVNQFQGLIDSVAVGPFQGNVEDDLSASLPTDAGYDIVVVAGQSNAVGLGLPPYVEAAELQRFAEDPNLPCQRICQLGRNGVNGHTSEHDLKVLAAVNPLDHWVPRRVGFATTFAKRLALNLPPNRKVLIVPVAKGGTSILLWDKIPNMFTGDNTNLYNDMIVRVQAALQMEGKSNRIVAFLWQQGEADISISVSPRHPMYSFMQNEQAYYAKLTELHQNIRRDLPQASCFPILMGLPSPDWVNPNKAKFESVITQVASQQPCSAVIPSAGLPSNASVPGSADTEHFSAQSQVNLGERYFKSFLQKFW